MDYQKLLTEAFPYVAQIYGPCAFELHRHHEIELIYSIKGSFTIKIDNQEFEVSTGKLVIISSMLPHEAFHEHAPDSSVLLIKIGPTFLRGSFYQFASMTFPNPVFDLKNPTESYMKKLKEYVSNLIACCSNQGEISELAIMGNLYQLCASIVKDIPDEKKEKCPQFNGYKNIAGIESVFEYIYLHYHEAITIDEVSKVAGYSKGNFCKVFKRTTGQSFHSYLNDFRIKNALFLLLETKLSIGEISYMVGFKESKTFCRVFKENTGITPTEYRKIRR